MIAAYNAQAIVHDSDKWRGNYALILKVSDKLARLRLIVTVKWIISTSRVGIQCPLQFVHIYPADASSVEALGKISRVQTVQR